MKNLEVGKMLKVDHREHPKMKRLIEKKLFDLSPDADDEIKLENVLNVMSESEMEETQLEIADYLDEDIGFAVERKSDDLIPEIRNGNLWNKLQEISQFQYSYLVVDKPMKYYIDWMQNRYDKKVFVDQLHSFMGAMASCVVRGFPPIFCRDKEMAAETIVRIYYKLKDDKVRTVKHTIRQKASKGDYRMNILINYPYIGQKTAKKLLDKFDNLDEINDFIKKMYVEPDREAMTEVGLNKRNVEKSMKCLIGKNKVVK